uniref:Alanine--tRNA ligase n=1 Tax=Pseudictyota dubia TaxID=2749911 RepID=A0A7R9WFC1_9STRA|mmetsp:Transcript_46572/g.86519  ORF Transcript_46572/g.86519 Transcript_46572/m.86519 type:complete len:461 (+) Transcript_46572:70-1452(+)|eukprot:CAMPEP_0197454496 /NCGR_PEP_ID=MMETSP1175-20131217/38124_1 /TAXON_ID=1003142 /ORGANISM="Triceratium dubium, Strain CCMP147" /LENGTH=460 /DNA_ID=CAMNT_0042988091 /DNA_START=53 /DNA_END=1435 /DNA_ORIENTATION=+
MTNQDQSQEWTTDSVRSEFCNYFSSRGHSFVPSSPCVPIDDPTLFFTNAGMNQFKPIFLDQIQPDSPLEKLRRVVNYQKCIRAGGKHNDLEDVGRDTYHHTFFEMLGSWSFGDYFKEEAIEMAFDLLVNVFRLEKERLYVTYFEGNGDVEPDLEARDIWLKILPKERVLGCGYKDNFWEMGDSGPCGPCSEIHYDRVGNRDASSLVNSDDPDVIEIWNIVFVQYERTVNSSRLVPLKQKHIDTGMGLERLVSILQGKKSNYDIDSFERLLMALSTESKIGPYTGKVGDKDTDMKDTAFRIVADHARTLCFSVADGAIPGNKGSGFVLRRILRRGMRYGQQILGCSPGLFSRLVPVVVGIYSDSYPELRQNEEFIVKVVTKEEKAFSKMLTRGIKYFTKVQTELELGQSKTIPGENVFFLHDSLGFPVDLTQVMASDVGLDIDLEGYKMEMQRHRDRSRRK